MTLSDDLSGGIVEEKEEEEEPGGQQRDERGTRHTPPVLRIYDDIYFYHVTWPWLELIPMMLSDADPSPILCSHVGVSSWL